MLSLPFPQKEPFTILQLTDLHLAQRPEKDPESLRLIFELAKAVRPDLLVFTGDIFTKDEGFQPKLIAETCAHIEKLRIPWAFCMGNHEGSHGEKGVRAQKSERMRKISPHLLFENGPPQIYGIGNYALALRREKKPVWMLYFLDSNDFTFHFIKGVPSRCHDAIRKEQIDWFSKTAAAVRKRFGSVPGAAFFHVPVPEFKDAVLTAHCQGDRLNRVTTPPLNTGFFAAALEQNVRAMFAGHDHKNSFSADVLGILLAYGRVSGYGANAPADFPRGGRVIRLFENGTVDTFPVFHRPKAARGEQKAVYRPAEAVHPPLFDLFDFDPK